MSQLYPTFLETLWSSFLVGDGPSPASVTLHCAGVADTYVFDSAHTIYADIEDFVILEPLELEGVTITGGVIDATDTLYTRDLVPVSDGESIPDLGAAVIYAAYSGQTLLMAYLDQGFGSLPQSLAGTNFTFKWNVSGIFKI